MNRYILKDLCPFSKSQQLPLKGYLEMAEAYQTKLIKEYSCIKDKIIDIKSIQRDYNNKILLSKLDLGPHVVWNKCYDEIQNQPLLFYAMGLRKEHLTSIYSQKNADVIHSLFIGKVEIKGICCNITIATNKSMNEALQTLQISIYDMKWCIPQVLRWNWQDKNRPYVYGPKALFPDPEDPDSNDKDYELLIRVCNHNAEYLRFMARPIGNQAFNQKLKYYERTF